MRVFSGRGGGRHIPHIHSTEDGKRSYNRPQHFTLGLLPETLMTTTLFFYKNMFENFEIRNIHNIFNFQKKYSKQLKRTNRVEDYFYILIFQKKCTL